MGIKKISDELQQLQKALLVKRRWEELPPDGLPAIKHSKSGKSGDFPTYTQNNEEEYEKQALNEPTENVNYILHLNTFHEYASKDSRLKVHHISLYMTLFHIWNKLYFKNRFPIDRKQVMQRSKIGSRSTYIECLKMLSDYGYITYFPSARPYAPCEISITPFMDKSISPHTSGSKKGTHASIKKDTYDNKNGPHTRPENVPHTNTKNDTASGPKTGHFNYNKLNRGKTESKQAHTPPNLINHKNEIPTMEVVVHWFAQKGQADKEGRKFFYHYEAVGWAINGEPITNWEAVAAKWVERTKNYGNKKTEKCYLGRDKSYDEPL
ncbi:hypothetical protein [[Flexibacter] sp. ATCC 35208]|uniref:hypothetical protein n=1 Tax=[Flexibacter] sp. ATCC 35208 TaxID=1936242 RepID=UPI0009C52AD1|nr:hypothetical protein [[Flexibacter] sp. ATCC 35208]OMP76106.1 hypothetical protein BW716_26685 [[Flexibacter] sp. ATCC 35208]